MGFTPTFYAGRPKLSEVTIDSDLNMGGRNISGVDTLQAGRVDSPYMPKTWPTEELDWGDIPPGEPIPLSTTLSSDGWITIKTFDTPPGDSYKWRFTLITSSWTKADFRITADGVELYSISEWADGTLTVDRFIPAGTTVTIEGCRKKSYDYNLVSGSNVQNLGFVCGPKTFNLTGKWLALGLDMKGLAATVKIQGVEMPYSDYPLYFPIAPTELSIQGEWDLSQERPIIEVYK